MAIDDAHLRRIALVDLLHGAPARPQYGHWKSLNSTIVTGASAGPSDGPSAATVTRGGSSSNVTFARLRRSAVISAVALLVEEAADAIRDLVARGAAHLLLVLLVEVGHLLVADRRRAPRARRASARRSRRRGAWLRPRGCARRSGARASGSAARRARPARRSSVCSRKRSSLIHASSSRLGDRLPVDRGDRLRILRARPRASCGRAGRRRASRREARARSSQRRAEACDTSFEACIPRRDGLPQRPPGSLAAGSIRAAAPLARGGRGSLRAAPRGRAGRAGSATSPSGPARAARRGSRRTTAAASALRRRRRAPRWRRAGSSGRAWRRSNSTGRGAMRPTWRSGSVSGGPMPPPPSASAAARGAGSTPQKVAPMIEPRLKPA